MKILTHFTVGENFIGSLRENCTMYTRPAENFKVSKAQTPFNFLGQKESIPQILGHLAVI